MNTKLSFLISLVICSFLANANIAPNPIKAKGIVPSGSTTIKMVSEKILVDLYQDSSVVDCYFVMKNEGVKQHIEIGFPEMNFHQWRKTNFTDFDKYFSVYENNNRIKQIDTYLPKSGNKSGQGNEEQPWYLWGSVFEKNETKIIRVKYRLPYGYSKAFGRYFTYLVNTGSNWNGKIDSSSLTITLKDIPFDLIKNISPTNYTKTGNQIKWVFTDFEPTEDNDIQVFYSSNKKEEERQHLPNPTYVINNQLYNEFGLELKNSIDELLKQDEILSVRVIKDSVKTIQYTSAKNGVIILYTKSYAIEYLTNLIKRKSTGSKKMKHKTPEDLFLKYELVVNEQHFRDKKMLIKALELEESEIENISIKKKTRDKVSIKVTSKTLTSNI